MRQINYGDINRVLLKMMKLYNDQKEEILILRILKLGILPEITPLWAFGNDFSSFQAVC